MHRTLVNVPWCVCLYVREVHMYISFINNILLSSYTGSMVNWSVDSPFLTLFRVELTATIKNKTKERGWVFTKKDQNNSKSVRIHCPNPFIFSE